MYSRVVLCPYKMSSASVKALQAIIRAQGIPCIRVYEDGNYRSRKNDLIINWGNPRDPDWHFHEDAYFLNLPEYIRIASNKLESALLFSTTDIRIPSFTTNIAQAMAWVSSGDRVLGRRLLNSSGGRGIIEFSLRDNPALLPEDFFDIPLFVKYIPKIAEYRVHVFKDSVIDVQRKRKSTEAVRNETINNRIRNHNNGWVFTRENCTPDNNLLVDCVRAVSVLGLDFGAVDVVVSKRNIPYILEVNTAPGLEGQTLQSYTNAIISLLRG